jgi:hypothetical protein
VDPEKPLDNQTMTALNLGWRQRTLAPGEAFTTTMALGLATTGAPGELPRLPAISDEAWSTWRRHLPVHSPTDRLHFVAERVELDLTAGDLTVDAEYVVENPSPASVGTRIAYPILVSRDRPAPATVIVDGTPLPVERGAPGRVQVEFPLSLLPTALRRFHVRYVQPLRGRQATYLVTSALAWPYPIDRAIFVVRYPARWRRATLSYPVLHRETVDGTTTLLVARQPFRPDREITLRW